MFSPIVYACFCVQQYIIVMHRICWVAFLHEYRQCHKLTSILELCIYTIQKSIYNEQNCGYPGNGSIFPCIYTISFFVIFSKAAALSVNVAKLTNEQRFFFVCVPPKVVDSFGLSCILKIGTAKIFWTSLRTLKCTKEDLWFTVLLYQRIISEPKSNQSKQLWILGLSTFEIKMGFGY